jgi:hypothetical protein
LRSIKGIVSACELILVEILSILITFQLFLFAYPEMVVKLLIRFAKDHFLTNMKLLVIILVSGAFYTLLHTFESHLIIKLVLSTCALNSHAGLKIRIIVLMLTACGGFRKATIYLNDIDLVLPACGGCFNT